MKPNEAERLILSEGFESDFYRVLRKYYIEGEWSAIARRSLLAPTMEALKHLQGQADALQQLHKQLKDINKQERKKDAK